MAKDFERFVVTWAELAEEWLKYSPQEKNPQEWTMVALRNTLRQAEQQAGYWTIGFLGQALLILMSHWGEITDLEAFAASLTPIESNVAMDTANAWRAKAQRQAQGQTNA